TRPSASTDEPTGKPSPTGPGQPESSQPESGPSPDGATAAAAGSDPAADPPGPDDAEPPPQAVAAPRTNGRIVANSTAAPLNGNGNGTGRQRRRTSDLEPIGTPRPEDAAAPEPSDGDEAADLADTPTQR
ncbi:MAG: hypothetical protein ACRDPI_05580, partial [Nocardioidaceae bacterium]